MAKKRNGVEPEKGKKKRGCVWSTEYESVVMRVARGITKDEL